MDLSDALLMTGRCWEGDVRNSKCHGEVVPCMYHRLLCRMLWCSLATLQWGYHPPVWVTIPRASEGHLRVWNLTKGERVVSRLAKANRHIHRPHLNGRASFWQGSPQKLELYHQGHEGRTHCKRRWGQGFHTGDGGRQDLWSGGSPHETSQTPQIHQHHLHSPPDLTQVEDGLLSP